MNLAGKRPTGMSYSRYCKEMQIARSTGYYKAKGESRENIAIMNLMDRHSVSHPTAGKGRCKDNLWIERFWRTIKQEYIYLHPTDDVRVLMEGIRSFIEYYNRKRPHQGIGNQLPSYRYAA